MAEDSTLTARTLESIRKENKLEIHDSAIKKLYDDYMKELKTIK